MPLRAYSKNEYQPKGYKYFTTTGTELFLHQHPITKETRGIQRNEADAIREKFINFLKKEIDKLRIGKNRKQDLCRVAELLHRVFKEKEQDWTLLPADTTRERNRSTLADHGILTSAFAVCLIKEKLSRGAKIHDFISCSPPLDEQEVIQITRIAAFCHDLGKLPPEKHNLRSKEAIKSLFSKIFDAKLVNIWENTGLRHHKGKDYQKRGETPCGFFEDVICHADSTASGADRITPLTPEQLEKSFEEIEKGVNVPDASGGLSNFEKKEFGKTPPVALLIGDVDRVKSYVFESAKLPEVRGASIILNKLNREDIEKIVIKEFLLSPECILYAAGGGILIIVPTSVAPMLSKRIEELYLKETKTATISVIHKPFRLVEFQNGISPRELWVKRFLERWENLPKASRMYIESHLVELKREDEEQARIKDKKVEIVQRFLRTKVFGECTTYLNYELRKKKEERQVLPIMEVTPFAYRCDSCEIRPASESIALPEEPTERQFLCSVCLKKRKKGVKGRGMSLFMNEFKNFLEQRTQNEDELGLTCKHFISDIKGFGKPFEEMIPRDLTSIGNASQGEARGYVGVIYADGNNIDKYLQSISIPAEYRLFSRELIEIIEGAVFSSLAKFIKPTKVMNGVGQEETILPFEIVSIGGDDVYLIVPADMALQIAYHICKEFGEGFKNVLTMSAGVLLAHSHHPIYYMEKIVTSLLKSAKKLRTGSIDFQVVTTESSLTENIEDYRSEVYCRGSRFPDESLTERPYTLRKLGELIEGIRELKSKDFPKSQLHLLRKYIVEEGVPKSRNFYHYQLARRDEWKEFHNLFFKKERKRYLAPWREEEGKTTPIVDIVEIYDFIREQ